MERVEEAEEVEKEEALISIHDLRFTTQANTGNSLIVNRYSLLVYPVWRKISLYFVQ